jgi:cysteine desulfurase
MDKRVLDAMMPYFTDKFGNPHSRSHSFGWEAEEGMELARAQVANVIKANSKDIVFTSGATESNNLALKGVASFYQKTKNHIITCVTEHKCVLDTLKHLEQDGFEVTYLPVDSEGIIDLDQLEKAIKPTTVLVSIMAVNNEIGVIQPLKEIGALCRRHGVFFHTDAAQAFGKIPLDVDEMNIDLMSISSHKIYGPKGVGALYVRRKPRVRLNPLINGGGQERGLRSGTMPTALIVGMGKAAEISNEEMVSEHDRLKKLSDKFYDEISAIPDVYLNGHRNLRWPGNMNFSFAYIEGESMIIAIKDIAVSSGSACTSASLEPSYVITALGKGDLAHTAIRFGFGRFTTEAEIDHAIKIVKKAVDRLREMSPLWEMVQDGVDLASIQWDSHH